MERVLERRQNLCALISPLELCVDGLDFDECKALGFCAVPVVVQDVLRAVVLAFAFGERNGRIVVFVHGHGILRQSKFGCNVAKVHGVARGVAESLDLGMLRGSAEERLRVAFGDKGAVGLAEAEHDAAPAVARLVGCVGNWQEPEPEKVTP